MLVFENVRRGKLLSNWIGFWFFLGFFLRWSFIYSFTVVSCFRVRKVWVSEVLFGSLIWRVRERYSIVNVKIE